MDKNQQDLGLKIAAAALVLSFFMNWISLGPIGISASSIVFSSKTASFSESMGFFVKLLLLVIPITGAVILYYFFQKGEKYPLDKKIIFCIPAAANLIFFILLYSKISDVKDGMMGFGDSLSVFDLLAFGFYLSVLASAFLVYLVFGKKPAPVKPAAPVEHENINTPVQ